MVEIKKAARMILKAEALTIRDVDGGESPFLYASGNWGPGYIMIKGLVGRKKIIKSLIKEFVLIGTKTQGTKKKLNLKSQ